MGKISETRINDFSRGITSDPREKDIRYAQFISNLEAHSFRHRLVPFRSTESGDSAADTSRKRNFTLALRTGTTYSLYALGLVSGTARAEVLFKNLTTGALTDLDDNGWSTPSNNQSDVGTTADALFVFYRRTGLIYGARGGTQIWAFDPTGAAAWNNSVQAVTYTEINQGIVHSKDNILYIPYYNNDGAANSKSFIASFNGTTWNTTTLTLPDDLIPTSICEYGNFLAIGCRPASGFGKSVVYLWDRDATLATLSESLDWGEGALRVLEEIDGAIVGISYIGFNTVVLVPKVVFRYYVGGQPQVFKELVSEAGFTAGDLPVFKQKINKNLYFLLSITLGDIRRQGLWKVGKSLNGEFVVVQDYTPNNGTALSSGTLEGFFIVGDYKFLAYVTSAVWYIDKTDDVANFTMNAIYQSLKFGEARQNKKLISVGVMAEPLPAAGQIVLAYRVNEQTAWTTIFTWSTDDEVYHEAINIESSGAQLPQFREIQFRILSTGNAVLTGLVFKYEEIDDEPSG